MMRIAIAAVIAMTGANAAAEPVSPLARRLSNHGRALHDLGDYQQAIVAYQEAYLIAPEPRILFNMAQAYRLAGNCDDAAHLYRRYLAGRPDPDSRRVAEEQLAIVDDCAQKTAITARVADEPDDGSTKRHVGVALVGAGGLSLAVATYFAIDASSASSDLSDLYKHGGSSRQIQDLDARGQRSSDLALGFAVAGGVAVVAGTVLYTLGRRDDVPSLAVSSGTRTLLAWEF